MKKKIIIGCIFAVLLMLSMPVISNIQAQPAAVNKKSDDCNICPAKKLGWNDDICDMLEEFREGMHEWEEWIKNGEVYYPWGSPIGPGLSEMYLFYIAVFQGILYFFYSILGCQRSD